jgi:hypothetical protein
VDSSHTTFISTLSPGCKIPMDSDSSFAWSLPPPLTCMAGSCVPGIDKMNPVRELQRFEYL